MISPTVQKWGFISLLIAAGMFLIYRLGKAKNQEVKYPNNGTGIPAGWHARIVSEKLFAAMDGIGTDTDALWAALDGLTPDQLAAVQNDFNQWQEDDLFTWFRGDLDGEDLSRALNYFKSSARIF